MYLIFVIWCQFGCSKTDCPNTGQKMVKAGAEMHSALVGHFSMPSSNQNWAHDSSLEIYSSLVVFWLMKQVIWILHLWENEIFPRSLQLCRKSLVTPVVLTFLPNHDTCVKNEGIFYFLAYDGKKPLSLFSISPLFGQKHHLKQNWP